MAIREISGRVLFYDAFVFQGGGTEVEQYGKFKTSGGKIVDGLGFVAGVQVCDGFKFEGDGKVSFFATNVTN